MMECVVVRVSLLCTLFLLFAAVGVADEPIGVPIDGDPFRGRLVAADSGGLLSFESERGRKEIQSSNLVRWGACVEPDRGPVFLLADGTLLVAGILEVTDKQFAVDSDSLGLVRLPRDRVAAIVLRLPASLIDRDRLLDEARRTGQDGARVVLLNGDEMRGELVVLDDQSVSLRTSVGPIQLEFDRISTITFTSAAPIQSSPNGTTIVGLADGSRVVTQGLRIREDIAELALGGGLSWQVDAAEVVFLLPASPRLTYLSDLEPVGYRHVPFLDQTWQFRTDRNVLGGLMRCAGQTYLKGIGVHTAARISYTPPEGARLFQASLGIDDATNGMGSVRFRIFVDGTQRYVSSTVRGQDQPTPISVNVSGAKRVDLVVDFADRADVQDHANWLDARFVR